MFSIYKSSETCRKANAAIQWDCSVTCAEESTPDSYVITYSDAKNFIQNRRVDGSEQKRF